MCVCVGVCMHLYVYVCEPTHVCLYINVEDYHYMHVYFTEYDPMSKLTLYFKR